MKLTPLFQDLGYFKLPFLVLVRIPYYTIYTTILALKYQGSLLSLAINLITLANTLH